MPPAHLLLSLSLLPLTIGCAARSGRSMESRGPLDHRQEMRLLSVSERFDVLVGNCRYEVVDSPNAGAFAWPDGRILVTRGLISLLNDEELAAAVAHEIGHLLADGHVSGRFSLHGTSGADDVEVRADALGCQILAQAGTPPASMTRMLQKLARAPGLTHRQRAAVTERIARSLAVPPLASLNQK